MNGSKNAKAKDKYPSKGLKATLEMKYIDEYLLSRGYRRKDLRMLPKKEARQLLIEASRYASLKLADIESRALYRKKYGSS
jgi:hypothetical protein